MSLRFAGWVSLLVLWPLTISPFSLTFSTLTWLNFSDPFHSNPGNIPLPTPNTLAVGVEFIKLFSYPMETHLKFGHVYIFVIILQSPTGL